MLPAATPLVGREAVLVRLHAALAQARQGVRQVLFLTGEPGIGKTAVLESFATQIMTDPGVWLASGQCIEHYGSGEPYLPVLDALGQLCRGPAGVLLGALLRQQAPTWLVQMPWLLTAADREHLQQELQGMTRERMLREFAELVETFTAETPLLLVLEDLHWSDHATLDLVALLARRRAPARLLLLGTYRPVELIVQNHPLRMVAQDLQQHGYGTMLPLPLLDAESVAAYLTARFSKQRFPGMLASWVHQHTDGNPLFLVTLVETLVARGVVTEDDGYWQLTGELEAVAVGVPEGLRPLLDQQLTRVSPEAQRVLEAASVVGVTFSAAAVAAALTTGLEQVEELCDALAQQHLIRPAGMAIWPDGTTATRYTFTHALYQQVAYERCGVGRRAHLHQRIGRNLEAAYGAKADEIAAELAMHFERGRDVSHAVYYLRQAAENAARRHAHHAVVSVVTRAMELLTQLPDTRERIQHELTLRMALGPALMATKGQAAPDVERTYARALELCQQIEETAQLCPVLLGLGAFYNVRGQWQTAQRLIEQALRLAEWVQDVEGRAGAHVLLGNMLFFCNCSGTPGSSSFPRAKQIKTVHNRLHDTPRPADPRRCPCRLPTGRRSRAGPRGDVDWPHRQPPGTGERH